jgi:hypothetical protein
MGLFDHLRDIENSLVEADGNEGGLKPDEQESLLAIALGRNSSALSFAARAQAAGALVRARHFQHGIEAWAAVSEDFPVDAVTTLHRVVEGHFQLGRYFQMLESQARAIQQGSATVLRDSHRAG